MASIQDLEAERAFLGCAFQEPEAVARYVNAVDPSDFAAPAHGKIWAAILRLVAKGQPVDHLLVATEIAAAGELGAVGGAAYLMALDVAVPFASNAESYAAIVRDRASRRRAVDVLRKYAKRAGDLDEAPDELLAEAAAELIRTGSGNRKTRTLAEVNREVYEKMNRVQDGEDVPVLATGIKAWDNALGGLQPTLTVIGGRTGGGKSALAAGLIQSIAKTGARIGVFSLEDAADWLSYRYIAGVSGVPNFVVRYRKKREDEWSKIAENIGQISEWDGRILIDDSPNLTSGQIVARATDMVVNHGARAIIVDHLQEIEPDGDAERHELELRKALQDLRNFANRFNVPVVLLAQAKEGADSKEAPTIYDFADAPNAVAKISRVAMIVRADPDAGTLDVYVVKHTNGNRRLMISLRFVTHAGLVESPKAKPEPADLFDPVDRSILAPPEDDEERPE